jgi:hypothetical protein
MGKLSAAASEIDITPPVGAYMTGYGARLEPSKGVHDELMARALLLEDGAASLVIVSCDLLGFEVSSVDRIRRLASERNGTIHNVMICCTHTHTGPAAMHMRGAMGHVNEEWLARTEEKIAGLIAGLSSNLAPAKIAYASRHVRGIGYNRQDSSRRIDDELGVLAVDGIDGCSIATILSYATHAVVLGTKLDFSGDFPGAAERHVAELRGGVALYLQGASGDAEPVTQRELGWGKGTHEHTEAIGEQLTREAMECLKSAQWKNGASISVASKAIDLPLEPPPTREALKEITRDLEYQREEGKASGDVAGEAIAGAMLEWAALLREAIETTTVPEMLSAELFVYAIDDLRIVGLPFEAYSDVGLEIKKALRPLRTVFAGYANGLFGYLAPDWAKKQGGYGPGDSCRWFPSLLTPISSEAHELAVSEAVALAKSL